MLAVSNNFFFSIYWNITKLPSKDTYIHIHPEHHTGAHNSVVIILQLMYGNESKERLLSPSFEYKEQDPDY